MFLPIDLELFPEDCRMVHLPSCNQWIYWIQKNGTTSLQDEHRINKCKLKRNDEIKDVDTIHVYIREPRDRYISGAHTYLEFLLRDNPELDRYTALWFIKKYKFLNRHYMPQFYWLVNLSRFINADARIVFHHLSKLREVTAYNSSPKINPIPHGFEKELLDDDTNMEFWFYIDQILYDLDGHTMTWRELLDYYQTSHPSAWDFVSKQIKPDVLS